MDDRQLAISKRALRRRDFLRWSLVGGVGLASMPVLQACTPAAPLATPSPTPGTPRPVKTLLTIAQSFQVRGFDPQARNADEEHALHTAIFNKLVDRDPDTMESVPALATSWRTLDPQTWEFTLRDDVTFHNGEPFNAEAVRFNVERIQDPDNASFLRTNLGALIDEVDVVNPTTVRLHTAAPDAIFLERLQIFWMVPPQYVGEVGQDGLDAQPVGTGPFRFVQWDLGQQAVVERNDDYFGTAPSVETVLFRTLLEPATALAELLTEGVDIVDGLPPDEVERVNASGVARLVQQTSARVLWIRVDALGRGGDTPLTDARVRRAAVMSIDRAAILESLQGGYGELTATPVVPSLFGHDPSITADPYDPDEARRLLEEANYPAEHELRFALYPISGFRNHRQLIETLVAYMGEVGMRVRVESVDPSQLSSLRTGGQLGDFSPGVLGGRIYDGLGNLTNFREDNVSAYYHSPELEEVLKEAEVNLDDTRRRELLSQAQRIWKEDVGGITLLNLPHMLGVNNAFDVDLTADWPRTPLTQVRPAS